MQQVCLKDGPPLPLGRHLCRLTQPQVILVVCDLHDHRSLHRLVHPLLGYGVQARCTQQWHLRVHRHSVLYRPSDFVRHPLGPNASHDDNWTLVHSLLLYPVELQHTWGVRACKGKHLQASIILLDLVLSVWQQPFALVCAHQWGH